MTWGDVAFYAAVSVFVIAGLVLAIAGAVLIAQELSRLAGDGAGLPDPNLDRFKRQWGPRQADLYGLPKGKWGKP